MRPPDHSGTETFSLHPGRDHEPERVSRRHDLVGQRFGAWRVIGEAVTPGQQRVKWLVECRCGTRREVRADHLRGQRSRGCGACIGVGQEAPEIIKALTVDPDMENDIVPDTRSAPRLPPIPDLNAAPGDPRIFPVDESAANRHDLASVEARQYSTAECELLRRRGFHWSSNFGAWVRPLEAVVHDREDERENDPWRYL